MFRSKYHNTRIIYNFQYTWQLKIQFFPMKNNSYLDIRSKYNEDEDEGSWSRWVLSCSLIWFSTSQDKFKD